MLITEYDPDPGVNPFFSHLQDKNLRHRLEITPQKTQKSRFKTGFLWGI